MAITREEIMAAFTRMLARSPESEAVITNNLAHDSVENAVRHIAMSPEFIDRFSNQFWLRSTRALLPFDEERVVFLHIPKCGGTTLHGALVSWYGAAAVHPERHNGLYGYTGSNLASKRVFSGHYDFYSVNLIPGPRKLITFLRPPRERLVSLYNFHRAHGDAIIKQQNLTLARWANQYDIDEYFRTPEVRAHPAINNTMAQFLSDQPQFMTPANQGGGTPKGQLATLCGQALKNLDAFDFIGFLDCYEASLNSLAQLLGKPAPAVVEKLQDLDILMITNPQMKSIAKQRPTDATLGLMDDLVAEDEKIYRRAKELFS
jgi:Sulfotransferase family